MKWWTKLDRYLTLVPCSRQGQVSLWDGEKSEQQPRFQPAGLKIQICRSNEAIQPTLSLDSLSIFHLLDIDLNNMNPSLILPKTLLIKKQEQPMFN